MPCCPDQTDCASSNAPAGSNTTSKHTERLITCNTSRLRRDFEILLQGRSMRWTFTHTSGPQRLQYMQITYSVLTSSGMLPTTTWSPAICTLKQARCGPIHLGVRPSPLRRDTSSSGLAVPHKETGMLGLYTFWQTTPAAGLTTLLGLLILRGNTRACNHASSMQLCIQCMSFRVMKNWSM